MPALNKLTIVTCECGLTYTKSNKARHLATARHIALMDSTERESENKSVKLSSTFVCSWRNKNLRQTRQGNRYFQKNFKYRLCATLQKHRDKIDSFAVGNEWEMLNPTSIYNRPIGEAAVISHSHCVVKIKDQLTIDDFKNFVETLGITPVDHVRLSVSLKDDIKFVTRDDVQSVIVGFDPSLASTRWKAHQYAKEVNGSYKLNWSHAVPSTIPTSERKIFEEYFNTETKQYQLERTIEIARATELRWWQRNAVNLIEQYDDKRTVWWFFDTIGNTGKTYLGEWFVNQNGIKLETGRSKDIAMAIQDPDFIVFDFARQTVGHINYSIIENIKNGRVWSSKYHSTSKVLEKIPTVICFANRMPNTGPNTLSQDRWRIFEIVANGENEHTLVYRKP
jgi:hypothetical protein